MCVATLPPQQLCLASCQPLQKKKPTDEDKKEILCRFGLISLSVPTMHNWLCLLGFKYKARKKYCFVDGHETVKTKLYRKKFVQEQLKLEKKCTGRYKLASNK